MGALASPILPGTGRGTIRRMVEGARPRTQPRLVTIAPTTTFQAVPLALRALCESPVPGRM